MLPNWRILTIFVFLTFVASFLAAYPYNKAHEVAFFWASSSLIISTGVHLSAENAFKKHHALMCLLLHLMNWTYSLNAILDVIPDYVLHPYDGRLQLSLLFYFQMLAGTLVFLASITQLAEFPYQDVILPMIFDFLMFAFGWFGFALNANLFIILSFCCFAYILRYINVCTNRAIQNAFLDEDKELFFFLKIVTYAFWSLIPFISITSIFLGRWFADLFTPMANSISKMWSTFSLVLGNFFTESQLAELRIAYSNENYVSLMHSLHYIETSMPMLNQATRVFKNHFSPFDKSFLASFIQSSTPTLKSIVKVNSILLTEIKNNPKQTTNMRKLIEKSNELLLRTMIILSESKFQEINHEHTTITHILKSISKAAEKITCIALQEKSLLLYFEPSLYYHSFNMDKHKIKVLLKLVVSLAVARSGPGMIVFSCRYNPKTSRFYFNLKFPPEEDYKPKAIENEMANHACLLAEILEGNLEISASSVIGYVTLQSLLEQDETPELPKFPTNVAVCLQSPEARQLSLELIPEAQTIQVNQLQEVLSSPQYEWLFVDHYLLANYQHSDDNHLKILTFFGPTHAIMQQNIVSQGQVALLPTAFVKSPLILESYQWRTNVHVLLVDDRKINNSIATILLSRINFRPVNISAVSCGKDAIEAVKAQFFGLILMDYEMPGMDGLQCAQTIREYEKTTGQRSRIFICTAFNAFPTSLLKVYDADFYLPKPLSTEALDRAIEATTT